MAIRDFVLSERLIAELEAADFVVIGYADE